MSRQVAVLQLFLLLLLGARTNNSTTDIGANIPPLAITESFYNYFTSKDNTSYISDGVRRPVLSRHQCGVRREAYLNKIVGGDLARPGEFPWQVSIQAYPDWKPVHICGGAILNEHWVITAAHCMEEIEAKNIGVVAGDYNLFKLEGQEQQRRLSLVVTNSFNTRTFARDIALLKVDRPFKLNAWVLPVCLPASGEVFSGEGTIAGWGRLYEEGRTAEQLYKVNVPLVQLQQCKLPYQQLDYDKYFSGCQICAGNPDGGQDACQGDSGGPLICTREDDNSYYLCGIVSWGIGCGRPRFAGVYTEVSCYSNWIDDVVNNRNNILGL